MKRYALLRLEHNSNKVIFECDAHTQAEAAEIFNKSIKPPHQLDSNGYCKVNETASLCVAEFYEPFYTVN
jgi:hypothetical protein